MDFTVILWCFLEGICTLNIIFHVGKRRNRRRKSRIQWVDVARRDTVRGHGGDGLGLD